MATEATITAVPSSPDAALAPARRWPSRLSLGHVVMLVAALLAALLNYSLLRAQDRTFRVAVAAAPLAAGAPVGAESFRFVDVHVDQAVRATLLEPASVSAIDGWVTAAEVGRGELIRTGDLRTPSAPGEQRAMSISVPAAHAAGGAIRVGDRVDVIEVRDGSARYVLSDAAVLGASGATGTAVAGPQEVTLTLAVDDRTALALAAAMHGDGLEIVRSTGAAKVG